MRKLKVVVIGAGGRGLHYAKIMRQMEEKYEVVAVADPIENYRNQVKDLYNLADDMCFDDYHPLFSLGKVADIAVIATMDREHFEPAMMAIDLGYDLLLEKPIAPSISECIKINEAANKKGVRIVLCTVLRYTGTFKMIKDIIDSGRIGKVMSINHEECVGNIHYSHSFVRGNWGNEEKSANMLIAKSCHDLDIFQWLIGKKCKFIQSFGTLSYFKAENAPANSPEYCIERCPISNECPYNAVKIYFEETKSPAAWYRTSVTRKYPATDEAVIAGLSTTQFGKCVFKCDNNVVDHQVVNMIFEDDVTVTFTMNAFNKGGRSIHIMGTAGEIKATLNGETPILVYDFKTKETEEISLYGRDDIFTGHGGGDQGIITDMYDYFCNQYNGKSIPTIEESLYSHLMAFAAEHSRKTNTVVNLEDFILNYDSMEKVHQNP